jgi:adenine deaminase
MMDRGLLVSVNSDDPANETYVAMQQALGLSHEGLAQLARNSFEAAFLMVARNRHFCAG